MEVFKAADARTRSALNARANHGQNGSNRCRIAGGAPAPRNRVARGNFNADTATSWPVQMHSAASQAPAAISIR